MFGERRCEGFNRYQGWYVMFDTHCHLDDLVARLPLPEVVARMRKAGVDGVISVGVAPDQWKEQSNVAQKAQNLGLSVGLAYGVHPWWADRVEPSTALKALANWIEQEGDRVLAIGEIGLDFAPKMPDAARQHELFIGQINIALQQQLPVILHERKSADQLLAVIRRHPALRGVVHGFTGSLQQAHQLIEQGFYLGVGTAITHPRATRVRAMLSALPVEALLLESDAPNQPGHTHRGEPNEPAFIVEQLDVLAELFAMDVPTLAEQLDADAKTVFGNRLLSGTLSPPQPRG
jgi:TatD DNase family protein